MVDFDRVSSHCCTVVWQHAQLRGTVEPARDHAWRRIARTLRSRSGVRFQKNPGRRGKVPLRVCLVVVDATIQGFGMIRIKQEQLNFLREECVVKFVRSMLRPLCLVSSLVLFLVLSCVLTGCSAEEEYKPPANSASTGGPTPKATKSLPKADRQGKGR